MRLYRLILLINIFFISFGWCKNDVNVDNLLDQVDSVIFVKSQTIFYIKNTEDFTIVTSSCITNRNQILSESYNQEKESSNSSFKVKPNNFLKKISDLYSKASNSLLGNDFNTFLFTNITSNPNQKLKKIFVYKIDYCFSFFYPLVDKNKFYIQQLVLKKDNFNLYCCISRPPPYFSYT